MCHSDKAKLFELMSRDGRGLHKWEKEFVNEVYFIWEGKREKVMKVEQLRTLREIYDRAEDDKRKAEDRPIAQLVQLRGQYWGKLKSGDCCFVQDILTLRRRNPHAVIPAADAKELRELWKGTVGAEQDEAGKTLAA